MPSWVDLVTESSSLSALFSQMLHPTVRLLVWGGAVVLSQLLPFPFLFATCLFVSVIAGRRAPRRLGLLFRRTRWLIVSLLALFALATPGLYLAPELGAFSPTEEGLRLGFEHVLRLIVILSALALLLERTSVEILLAGLHGLMRPLEWLGQDRGRLALRLMLVLRYVEQAPPGRHWREWLDAGAADPELGPMSLRRHKLSVLDVAVLAGLTFLLLFLFGIAA